MIAVCLISLLGLVIWTSYVSLHNLTVAREVGAISRAQRLRRLARWGLLVFVSGLMLLAIGEGSAFFVPRAWLLLGQVGPWLYRAGVSVGAAGFVCAAVAALRQGEPVEPE